MINEVAVRGVHNTAVDLTRRLELLFNERSAEMRELLAAGVSPHRVASLYPFSLEGSRAAIHAMTASEAFTHSIMLSVTDLHPLHLESIAPAEVVAQVGEEFLNTNPYLNSEFAAGDLMALSAYMHHLANFDITDLLALRSPIVHDFDPDWAINDQWEDLSRRLSAI